MPTLITAGDASAGLVQTASNDGALTLQTGPAGSKVNAIALASDGTPTLVKGPTIGTAPTPVPSGSAPMFACRAWVNFDGTGTIGTNMTIRASGNVSSVFKNATGDYTVNFTNAMPDANYAVITTGDVSSAIVTSIQSSTTPTTSAVRVRSYNTVFASTDNLYGYVAIFR